MEKTRLNEIKLIFLLAFALIIFISLLTYDQSDIRFLTSGPNLAKNNVAGFIGAYLAWGLFFLMGFGAYVVPFFIALWGIISLSDEKPGKFYFRLFGGIFLILAASSIFSLLGIRDNAYRFQKGGIIGLIFSDFLVKYLGLAGTMIAILVLLLLSLIITTDFLVFPFVVWLFGLCKLAIKKIGTILSGAIKAREAKKEISPAKAEPVKVYRDRPKPRETTELGKFQFQKPKETEKPKESPRPAILPTRQAPRELPPYDLPNLNLLTTPPPIEEREIKENLEENSQILEDTLRDFGIETKVVKVSKGPVITRYELEPASGVKVHKITSLSDNIALAMKSVSVRIVAPIPGKGTIGVEVPNLKSAVVYLREILESKEYRELPSKLKLALGKDISGTPIVTDLDDMPHLLIAGATGSGKTVCVNGIIMTLLFNASPDELKFLMVDPKRVELAAFNDLPHLLSPVVTDPKKVSHALNWVVNEMERRFELFVEVGVKNITAYKKKEKSENLAVLPYIVVIIDELADLMLVAQQDVENIITRLAQLSRAVGIHMIIATQRPSVDVITGVIKANFPARISFKVASKVDSRTVLDMNGAEKLLGKGDLLFIEPGNPKPIRAQGGLVTDEEITRTTEFIKSQRRPDFADEILKVEDKPQYKKFEKDEVYEEAVRLVLETRQASVSMLQRRLGVGYTRAARIIDMMEDDRIVGPYQGSKPREILIENIEEEKLE